MELKSELKFVKDLDTVDHDAIFEFKGEQFSFMAPIPGEIKAGDKVKGTVYTGIDSLRKVDSIESKPWSYEERCGVKNILSVAKGKIIEKLDKKFILDSNGIIMEAQFYPEHENTVKKLKAGDLVEVKLLGGIQFVIDEINGKPV